MDRLIQLASAHLEAIGFVGGYLLFGAVAHLPKPGTKVTPYEYFYDLTRTFLNLPGVQKYRIPESDPNGAPK